MAVAVAGSGDEAELIALWAACGLTRPWNDPAADFARAIAAAHSTILVLRHDGAITGSVMVGHDGHRGWVYYLAVAPERRGCGLGRLLMRAAEDWLRIRAVPKLQLMVREGNREARAFYAALEYGNPAGGNLGEMA